MAVPEFPADREAELVTVSVTIEVVCAPVEVFALVVTDGVKAVKRLVFPCPTPTAGTEPCSFPAPVWVAMGGEVDDFVFVSDTAELDVESVAAAALAADEVSDAETACVAGSIVVWVNRLNKLVFLVPPTPTAGTAPFSVPFPVCVAKGGRFDVSVAVALVTLAGSVGPCRFSGILADNERPLMTYRLGG